MVYGFLVWLDLDELSAVGVGSVPLRRLVVRHLLRRLVLFPAVPVRISRLSGRPRKSAASRSPTAPDLSSGDGSLRSQWRRDRHRSHASARSKREDSLESGTRRFCERGNERLERADYDCRARTKMGNV